MHLCRGIVLSIACVALPLPAGAAWNDAGNPLTLAPGTQDRIVAIPFGSGGVLVAWVDARGDAGDVYAMALDAAGAPMPGWPANGAAICTAAGEQHTIVLAPDAQGGAYVLWKDERPTAPGRYLTRIGASGVLAAGWTANGLFVTSEDIHHALAPDGAGGVYLWWAPVDWRARVMHLGGGGSPVAGWPVALGISSCCARDGATDLIADGAGGVIAVGTESWCCDAVRAFRLGANGAHAPGWPASGVLVTTNALWSGLVRGTGSDAFVYWYEMGCLDCDPLTYAHHLLHDGSLDPGWPSTGVDFSVAPWPVGTDGVGGVLTSASVSWLGSPHRAYASRLLASGAKAYGSYWTTICDQPADQRDPSIAPDGGGGAFVSWIDHRDGTPTLYGMRLDAAGDFAAGWPTRGSMECLAALDPSEPKVVATGAGSAVVVWTDVRNGSSDVFAKPLLPGPEGPAYLAGVTGASAWFGIRSIAPNPARDVFRVVLASPDAAPAQLDLIDVAGRLVARRVLSGAELRGSAVIVSASETRMAGVYWLRFRQGSRAATKRIVIAR